MAVGAMARGADRAERVQIGFEPRPRRFEADAAAAGEPPGGRAAFGPRRPSQGALEQVPPDDAGHGLNLAGRDGTGRGRSGGRRARSRPAGTGWEDFRRGEPETSPGKAERARDNAGRVAGQPRRALLNGRRLKDFRKAWPSGRISGSASRAHSSVGRAADS